MKIKKFLKILKPEISAFSNLRFNKNLKNKKSQGHIEIIISFILFFSAIVLIFYFLNPFAKAEDKNPSIERVERIILENVTYSFGRVSVVNYDGDCKKIPQNPPTCCYRFISTKYYGMKYVENAIEDKNIDLYFSNHFTNTINPHFNDTTNAGGILYCHEDKFRFGEFQNESIIYYQILKYDAEKGKTDYQGLRRELGINYDFSFNVSHLNRSNIDELSFSRRTPTGIEVAAREFPIRIINDSGQINEYIFNLRVW